MLPPLPDIVIEPIVRLALAEDFGRAGDVTTNAIVRAGERARFALRARVAGVVAGMDAASLTARLIDRDLVIHTFALDGALVAAGECIAEIEGFARSTLTAERTILNFIGRLSGISTLTRRYVDAITGTDAQIISTRKTTPGLRALEKRAVLLGGGGAHRYGLDDAILIKDNHIALAGSVDEALKRAKAAAGHLMAIEVEVDSLDQLEQAMRHAPHAILLDNFELDDLARAAAMVRGRTILEASGGVRLDNVRTIAETGVNYISVGALTHSAPALGVGLDAV